MSMTPKKEISPQERALRFAQATRNNWQMMPSKTVAAGKTVKFDLDKVRLGARVRLLCEATLTAVHATETSFTPAVMAPYSGVRRAAIDMNNGFSPFIVEGTSLYLYNMVRDKSAVLTRSSDVRAKVSMPTVAAANTGAANAVKMVLDMPFTLNDQTPSGLVLLQNAETLVTVTLDMAAATDLVPAATGYTFTLSDWTITPMVETFSVPVDQNAKPDISILKLVQDQTQDIAGAGVKIVKLPVGTIYRKLIIFIKDANGAGVADSSITGDFELVFNNADSPYRVSPKMLAAINHEQFGRTLPTGVYVFDFSYQGFSGYGGGRDLIDTEKLTEFWFKYNAPAAGSVTAVFETLAKMR